MQNLPRTVTVQTSDYGPVTTPEPPWCTGTHVEPIPASDGTELLPRREDIAHTGPAINVTVGTRRGPRRLLELLLWQDPFPTPLNANGTDVYVAVHLLDGDTFDYDPVSLDVLATELMEAAAKVRRVARRLAVEHRTGGTL